jgi:cobalamin biosynthesis protein CobT
MTLSEKAKLETELVESSISTSFAPSSAFMLDDGTNLSSLHENNGLSAVLSIVWSDDDDNNDDDDDNDNEANNGDDEEKDEEEEEED